VAAALNLDRRAFAQSGLGRPLVTGLIIGWLLGDLRLGLTLGLWTELLWLWRLTVGGDFTPNGALALSAVLVAISLSYGYNLVKDTLPLDVLAFALIPVLAHLLIIQDKLDRGFSERLLKFIHRELEEKESPRIMTWNLLGLTHTFVGGLIFLALAVPLLILFFTLCARILPQSFWTPFINFRPLAPAMGLISMAASFTLPALKIYALGLICGLALAFFLY
jgi:mannose/fructose/N-acetylgalactosamine-specific phosphotransferase system component IIC